METFTNLRCQIWIHTTHTVRFTEKSWWATRSVNGCGKVPRWCLACLHNSYSSPKLLKRLVLHALHVNQFILNFKWSRDSKLTNKDCTVNVGNRIIYHTTTLCIQSLPRSYTLLSNKKTIKKHENLKIMKTQTNKRINTKHSIRCEWSKPLCF